MAAVKQKAKQELIVYPRGDEEIEEMGDYVSYSAALKHRKLGVALCRSNPAANRQLTSQLQVLDRQQHRRRFDLQHKQCEFFVQQLFEKRLNPFLKRPKVRRRGYMCCVVLITECHNSHNHSQSPLTRI